MSKQKTERKVTGESKSRNFSRMYWGEVRNFKVSHSWHLLDDGVTEYHYIHLYIGINHRPFKRWAWSQNIHPSE